jgi:hypothetical protein
MTNDLNIFDAYSRIRDLSSDADVAAIEALPDDHRTKLFECIAAVKASEAGSDRAAAALAAVRTKGEVYNACLESEQKSNPPSTHKSALAAVIAANAGLKPEPVKVNKKTKAALAEADMALAEARSELTRATGELRTLEAKAGEAINAWRKCLTTPTDEEVRREYVNASSAQRARRVAAGLPADAQKEIPTHRWEIERVFAARGKVQNRQPKYYGRR